MVGVEEARYLSGKYHWGDYVGAGVPSVHDDRPVHVRCLGVQDRDRPAVSEHLGLHHELVKRDRSVDPGREPARLAAVRSSVGGEVCHPRTPRQRLDAGQHGPAKAAPAHQVLARLVDQLRRTGRGAQPPQGGAGVAEAPGMQLEVMFGGLASERAQLPQDRAQLRRSLGPGLARGRGTRQRQPAGGSAGGGGDGEAVRTPGGQGGGRSREVTRGHPVEHMGHSARRRAPGRPRRAG